MSIRNKSVAIRNPEFLNLSPLAVNRLMSKCDIKVLYTGKNRNGSMISKDVATQMAETLRGSPIVGYYSTDREDFRDHGHRLILDGDGAKEEVLTIPYGFVSPDAKVWFQVFEDTDDFGEKVEREYLMCEGYIWNGQFKEADKILKEGQPQSMEIEGSSLDGHWANDNKTGRDFFIITDAEFSKLCILGDDVEPCFEGASITAANTSFSLVEDSEDSEFKATLLKMMEELKFALEGGHDMDNETVVTPVQVEATVVSEEVTETPEIEESALITSETPAEEDFEKKDEEKEETSDDEKKEEEEEEEDKQKPKSENSLDTESTPSIEQEYAELKSKFETLSADYAALTDKCAKFEAFYNTELNKQKDALIEKFYMLSEEDKKDIIEHKADFSLEEIESKLAVICFRKKVNFNLEESDKNEDKMIDNDMSIFTYTMDAAVDNDEATIPEWLRAVDNNRNK